MPDLNKILYVEDEPDIQAIARIALENVGGFKLEICDSGQDAIKIAPDYLPDLILLDVMMPGMDGPTTLKELRKIDLLKNTPVMFMTAKVQPQEIQQFKSMGAIEVIAKPFDPMKLADTIKKAWSSQ